MEGEERKEAEKEEKRKETQMPNDIARIQKEFVHYFGSIKMIKFETNNNSDNKKKYGKLA